MAGRIGLRSPWSLVWVPLVAWLFFLMSNPMLVFFPFDEVRSAARWSVLVAVLLTLPRLRPPFRASRLPRLPRQPWPPLTVVAVVGLMWLSALWSLDAGTTRSAALLYTEVAVYALVVAAAVTPGVVAAGLSLGGLLTAGWSAYGYERRLPGYYYDALEGPILAGVGTNQNILAYTLVVALGAHLAFFLPRTAVMRVVWAAGLAGLLAGLLAAGSATGYLTTVLLLVTAVSLHLLRSLRVPRGVWPAALAGIAAMLVAGLYLVETVMGKDATTFSSRSPFWTATLEAVAGDGLLLGHGWGAVWAHPWAPAPHNDVVQRIYDASGLALTHGHNALVDVVPALGLVGVALFAALVVHAVVRSWATHRELALLLVVALLGFGVTEPMLTVPLGWWTVVLLAALPTGRPTRPEQGAPRHVADADADRQRA